MIIVINGAYGVGKSTVANQLKIKMPGAIIYDPEEVGFMLRNLIPEELKHENERTGDFQDLELWKFNNSNDFMREEIFGLYFSRIENN